MMRGLIFSLVILLAGTAGLGATPGQVHPVPDGGLALRDAPDDGAAVIGEVRSGQRLLEFERRGDWVRVGVFGGAPLEGWVPDAQLATLPPEPVEEPEPPVVIEEEALPETAYILDITGTPALQFIGHCIQVDALGARHKAEFKGAIPKKYRLTAPAVRCTVQKWDARGRLQVALREGGKLIAAQETAAQFNWVQVFSAGPWGKAGNVRGNNPTVVFPRRDRGGSGGVVPPFKPPIIPRFPVRGAS